MARCYDCKLEYGGDEWIEAVIPDKVWNDISPTKNLSGILCITCICRRLAEKGYKDIPVWLCGTEPISVIPNEIPLPVKRFIIRNWEPDKGV